MIAILLQTILSQVDEEALFANVRRHHFMARMKFSRENITVKDFRDFSQTCIDFHQYLSNAVFNHCATPEEIAWGTVKRILSSSYGSIEYAYNDALNGYNGGLKRIFDVISEALMQEHETMYIHRIYDLHIEPMDFEKKKLIVKQYFEISDTAGLNKKPNIDLMASNITDFLEAVRKNRAQWSHKAHWKS